MENICGIYQIQNTINGKVYVGSAVNIKKRWSTHICQLKSNYHDNKHLQAAWNKYGINMFIFSILEKVPLDLLAKKESQWMHNLQSFNRKKGYNIEIVTGEISRKKFIANETKEKIRLTKLGLKLSEETKQKISTTKKGRSHPTPTSFRKGHITWNKGIPRDEKTKQKLSEISKNWLKTHKNSFKGRRHSQESITKMSSTQKLLFKNGRTSWNKGKKGVMPIPWTKIHGHTEVTKQKIREARAKQIIVHSEETKRKISVGNKGKHFSKTRRGIL